MPTGSVVRGRIHSVEDRMPAGRVGEPPASGLAATLERAGFRLGRLKTGTPPRLDGRTIDYAGLQEQVGDDPPELFSTLTHGITQPQVPCHITHTSEPGHALIRANLHRAHRYSAQIASTVPRYCPSIAAMLVRFAELGQHPTFLDPGGLSEPTQYP